MKKFTISIGLNDQYTKRQQISTPAALKIISDIVVDTIGYGTIYAGKGVYTHQDGVTVSEETIIVEYIGDDESKVKNCAWYAKKALNQESVMLEETVVKMEFI